MQVEQFIIGDLGDGYEVKESNVSTLISREAYDYLKQVGAKAENDFETWNVIEGVLAVSFVKVKHHQDRYGRWTIWNHTFLVRIQDYLNYAQVFTVFRPRIVGSFDQVPDRLETLDIS